VTFFFPSSSASKEAQKIIIIMSNPVVFFDMEIGGQPAGRIEMTVRLLANTPFPFLGKNTTTLSDLFFFF